MLGGGLGALWSHDDTAGPWPHRWDLQAYVIPALTYFVRDGIGIGVLLGGLYGTQHVEGGLTYDIREYEAWAGLVGIFELPLGPRTGLFTVVRLSYVGAWHRIKNSKSVYLNTNAQGRNFQEGTPLADQKLDYDTYLLRPSLHLPLVIHASSPIALGFGPELWVDYLLSTNAGRGIARPSVRYSVGASSWVGVSF